MRPWTSNLEGSAHLVGLNKCNIWPSRLSLDEIAVDQPYQTPPR